MSPAPALPWSHPLRLAELTHTRTHRFELTPSPEARAALAEDLGILGIRKLRFAGELRPRGRDDWDLVADLGATVVQACIVTLAPVATRLDEPVEIQYRTDLPEPEAAETEVPEQEMEPLPAVLDLGEVLREALALALPPYPRAEGAELGALAGTPPGAEPIAEEKIKPFAGLSDLLRDRAKDPDSGPGNGGGV